MSEYDDICNSATESVLRSVNESLKEKENTIIKLKEEAEKFPQMCPYWAKDGYECWEYFEEKTGNDSIDFCPSICPNYNKENSENL